MMRIALVGVLAAAVQAEQVSPIGKVLELMSDLQAKVLKEGEGAQKVFPVCMFDGVFCVERRSVLKRSRRPLATTTR